MNTMPRANTCWPNSTWAARTSIPASNRLAICQQWWAKLFFSLRWLGPTAIGNAGQSALNLDQGVTSMMQRVRHIGFGLFTALAIVGYAGQAPAAAATQERFEVTSIKAVRP